MPAEALAALQLEVASVTEAGVVQAEGRDGPEEEELGQVWWAAQH